MDNEILGSTGDVFIKPIMENEILGSNGDVFIKPILNLMYNKKGRRTTIDTIELIIKHIYITCVDFFQEFIELLACFVIIANIFIRKLLPGDIIYPSDPRKFPYVYYGGDDNGIDEDDDDIQRLITHSQLFDKESYSKYETVFDSIKLSDNKEVNKKNINNINDKHAGIFDQEIINTIHNPSKEKLSIFASMFQHLNYEKIPSNSWPSALFSYVLLFNVIKINDIIKSIMDYIPNVISVNEDKSHNISNTNVIIFASIIFLFKYLSSLYPFDYSNIISDSVFSDNDKTERENRSTILGEILFLFIKTLESFIKPFFYILIIIFIIVYIASLLYTCVAFYKYSNAINRGKGSGAIFMYLYSNLCMFFLIIKTTMLLNEAWFVIKNSTCDDTSLFYFVRRNRAKHELKSSIKQGGIDRLEKAIQVAIEYELNVSNANNILNYEKYRKTVYNNLKTVNDKNIHLIYKWDDYTKNHSEIFTKKFNIYRYNQKEFDKNYCDLSDSKKESLRKTPDTFSKEMTDIRNNIKNNIDIVTGFTITYSDKDYYRDVDKNGNNSISVYLDNLKKIKSSIDRFTIISSIIASTACSLEIYKEAANYQDDKKSLVKKTEKKYETNKPNINILGKSIFGGSSKGKLNKNYKKLSGNAEKDVLDFFREFGEFSRSAEDSTVIDLDYQEQLSKLMSTQVATRHAQIDNNNRGDKKEKYYSKRQLYISIHINRMRALFPDTKIDDSMDVNGDMFKLGKYISTNADKSVYDNLRKNMIFSWTESQTDLNNYTSDENIRKFYFRDAPYLDNVVDKLKVNLTFPSGPTPGAFNNLHVLWTLTRDEFIDYIKYCKLSDHCKGYDEYKLWNGYDWDHKRYKSRKKKNTLECFMQRIKENKIIEGAEFDPSRRNSPSKCSIIKEKKEKNDDNNNFTKTFIYYMIVFPIIIPMFLPEAAALWKTFEITIGLCFGSFYQYEYSKEPFIDILGNVLSLFKVKIAFFVLLFSSIINIFIESSKHKYSAVKFPTILIILLSLITGNSLENKPING